MLKPKTLVLIAVGLAAAAVVVAYAGGAFNTGPQVPNVKFVSFSPEGKQTIKENQSIEVKLKVKNYESYDVATARITTVLQGDSRYFAVDNSNFLISPAVAGPNGESRDLVIRITGSNLGSQQAIEDKLTISLFVGADVTDGRRIDVRLEK